MLSLLLARKGIPVTLLEAHKDFDREFRGDTLHPSTMELMDQLGLADSLLELPHTKIETAGIQTPSEKIVLADFSRLRTPFSSHCAYATKQFSWFRDRRSVSILKLHTSNGSKRSGN